ncbi:hypothetical protein SAMN02745723_11731 [Pragia fontium DSM 5563 = ATCC 49100]|uniref:Uncharacterized protein n=1 Tax=Pragia fontium DSM 5563 = ATCC 49100 TaxID=1122977 RepID=A0AAJ5BIM7_9GAMM|nr:hypothetical protein SAMN02745723_11731 [Pragia fontium DSM 5563 = ATCC 49100]
MSNRHSLSVATKCLDEYEHQLFVVTKVSFGSTDGLFVMK